MVFFIEVVFVINVGGLVSLSCFILFVNIVGLCFDVVFVMDEII